MLFVPLSYSNNHVATSSCKFIATVPQAGICNVEELRSSCLNKLSNYCVEVTLHTRKWTEHATHNYQSIRGNYAEAE